MSDVVLLSGSPNVESKTSLVIQDVGDRLQGALTVEHFSVQDIPADDLISGNFHSPEIKAIQQSIANAYVVIIGSPIYKASITGALKALLDVLPEHSFTDKTILPIATGGSTAHYLSLDYSLIPVVHALGATHVLKPIYILSQHLHYEKNALTITDDITSERINQAVIQVQKMFPIFENASGAH